MDADDAPLPDPAAAPVGPRASSEGSPVSAAPDVDPFVAVDGHLAALARRAVQVLVARALLAGGCALGLGFTCVGAIVAWRGTGGGWAPLWPSLVLLATAATLAWVLRGIRGASHPRAQAQLLETRVPGLRGRLLASLDRQARPMGSVALRTRATVRALAGIADQSPTRVHPWSDLRVPAAAAAASAGLLGLAVAFGAASPVQVLALLVGSDRTATATATDPAGPRAVIGDVVLRYVYPVYTRLEPLVVENSNGEVHAPPGTRVEVRARTARVAREGTFVAYVAAPVAALGEDGRALQGALDVSGVGTWHFVVDGVASADVNIVPEPDLAPDVVLQGERKVVEASSDAPLPLRWTARDDYGLREVKLEIREGGKAREVTLSTLQGAPREAAEPLRPTPADLGLLPGSHATVRVGAWDNDEVSGSKVGWSNEVQLEVLGPRGRAARADRYRVLMRDALVGVLADTVLEPTPAVGVASLAPGWAARADARYATFDAVVREAWGGVPPASFDATVVRVLDKERRAVFGFAAGLGSGAGARDLESLSELQARHLETLEDAILALDSVIRAVASRELVELVGRMAAEARRLQDELPRADARAIRARVEALDRMRARLQERAAALEQGSLRDFIEDRARGLESLSRATRDSLAAGRLDEGRTLAGRYADEVVAMQKDLEDMQARGRKQDDATEDAMKELEKELRALRDEEARLRERTERARERFGPDMAAAVAVWEEVERRAQGVVATARGLEAAHPAFRDRSFGDRNAMDEARDAADALHDAARARSLQGARDRAGLARDAIEWLGRRADRAGEGALSGTARRMAGEVQRIEALLARQTNARSRTSPALAEELRAIAEDQQGIAERASRAAKGAERIANELPMDAPGLVEGAQQGAEESAAAEESLRAGDAVRGGGAQRSAEDGFGEALEALRQAQQMLQQMKQAAAGKGGGGGSSGGEPGDEDGGGGEGDQEGRDDIQIPLPADFRTPEEYRKALLEGMRGDVPEEYRALNRRYYEELVRQ